MKILYVASEAAPFVKTGGLADVAGSLPKALKEKKQDIRVIMPLYWSISDELKSTMKKETEFSMDLGWRNQYVGVFSTIYNGVTHYFVDNEYYFKRDRIYGEYDDGERFIYFSKAVAIFLKKINFKADIVHSNDWHSGLVPLYIKDFAKGDPFYQDMKTVFTIHNLKYQGIFDSFILQDIGGLSDEYIVEDGLKYYDKINLMKAGIAYSDALTTVSKTYAEEIKYEYFGEGLEGIIRKNQHKLTGIVNGIDYDLYNPTRDNYISANYDFQTIENKSKNKRELQNLYDLPKKDVPVLAMVSRLVAMKGLDLVVHILDELLQEDIQFVVLGTGEKKYEDIFNYFQWKYSDKLRSRIYFNGKESHLIYAGADIFVMPSMAEPCGISQLISLRYGTLPVVRETGGLKDTVIPYNKYTGEGTGFSFENFNAHELLNTIKTALQLYEDKGVWHRIIEQAMKSKNDWGKSSQEYMKIYKRLKI
ncbi:MAG: glycogen synthase GlgA [Tissierellaceae bacterium]|nr:glycogen synthase GlgA [Tissierellaceae bacterium]